MSPRWSVPLPYTRPPLSLNQRSHRYATARATAALRRDTAHMARFVKIPTGLERVHVSLHWQPAAARTRDTDNLSPTLKAAIDGLRDAHVLVDDDSSRVSSQCVIEPVARPGRLWLTVERWKETP